MKIIIKNNVSKRTIAIKKKNVPNSYQISVQFRREFCEEDKEDQKSFM